MIKIKKKTMMLAAANAIFFLLIGLLWYSSGQIKTEQLEFCVNYGDD